LPDAEPTHGVFDLQSGITKRQLPSSPSKQAINTADQRFLANGAKISLFSAENLPKCEKGE
jgi:hypothetical protein